MSGSYTKNDLIRELAASAKISKRRAEMLLAELATIAYREAVNGFTVPGICKLDVVPRKERRARNPQTGDTLLIGAHNILRVRPLKRAKLAVAPIPLDLVSVIPAEQLAAEAAAAEAAAPKPAPAPQPQPPPPPAAGETAVSVEPSLFSFSCPYCAVAIEVTTDCVGDRVQCPACTKSFVVPEKGKLAKREAKPAAKATAAAPAEEQYVSFLCKSCGQEIEAPIDMAGSQAECPACGSVMLIPYVSEPGTTQAVRSTVDAQTLEAYKSRTIRIELPDDV